MTTPGSAVVDATANNLLRALRPNDLALIRPHLRETSVLAGQVLYEPGDDVQHVYFPVGRALLAFRILLDDGRAVETALVGREGAMAGIVVKADCPPTPGPKWCTLGGSCAWTWSNSRLRSGSRRPFTTCSHVMPTV
jgi:hypothetical protein